MRTLIAMIIAIILLFISTVTSTAFAQEQVLPDSTIAALNDVWSGKWTDQIGYLYIAEMHLAVSNDGTVEGEIKWLLKQSPRDYEQAKLGLTGIEFVRGKYNAANRVLSFAGYKKNDPDTILGLDQYKLFLAENEMFIGGITYDNGTWGGLFSVSRTKK
jgi:hypothetical protein